ncbi:IDEAL domain-containing protein [Rossellomorea sp. BNER]|uniref:IDEAL domain-containing protein n=1 Tax=Rossellomorea sp. BNER TaxID=2962031 RepID=UPI003AF2902E|nr:IDEAL domain-containing protein [Rossellomorea sp. BNER]
MDKHFIAVESFEHQIDCFCPGGIHAELLRINKEDIIEVTKDCNFVMDKGWYVWVVINDHCSFYMALEDLEKYMMKGLLISRLDLDLKINYLQFLIDQALDKGDEVSFLKYSTILKDSSEFKAGLENYYREVIENHSI